METKAGYVAIIGKPNVGKSTLMNTLLKERLSIITNKPQTTRKRILGILTEEDYQIVFFDTPGILDPHYLMQERMMDHVNFSVADADILVFMVDGTEKNKKILKLEENFGEKILNSKKKKILVINKIDKIDKEKIDDVAGLIKEKDIFDSIFGVSAKTDFNLDAVKMEIVKSLPKSPFFYPEDQLTVANERFYVSEIIREKILELYREEVPYSVEVKIEEFKERKKGKDFISASIIVEKESQKPIIIGKKGDMIKKLGELSRNAIDEFLDRTVFLELRVKVREKWRSDKNMLRNFGYNIDD